jgi:hypothetical protein
MTLHKDSNMRRHCLMMKILKDQLDNMDRKEKSAKALTMLERTPHTWIQEG